MGSIYKVLGKPSHIEEFEISTSEIIRLIETVDEQTLKFALKNRFIKNFIQKALGNDTANNVSLIDGKFFFVRENYNHWTGETYKSKVKALTEAQSKFYRDIILSIEDI